MRRAALALALVLVAVAGWLAVSGSDPAAWHVDPLRVARAGSPNDCLAAPPGVALAPTDRDVPVWAEPPGALLARFDAVARAAPRVAVVASAVPGQAWTTYVQRSAVFRFPDYISVRAVAVPGGASLAIYSRSRYGYSDLGVNRARVDAWIAALGHPSGG